MTSVVTRSLLTSPDLQTLVKQNSERLSEAYQEIVISFTRNNIPFIPCDSGLYILAKVAPDAKSWEEERQAIAEFKANGVLLSAGEGYHMPSDTWGWARITFAVDRPVLKVAMEKMQTVFEARRRRI